MFSIFYCKVKYYDFSNVFWNDRYNIIIKCVCVIKRIALTKIEDYNKILMWPSHSIGVIIT